jgi:hypothetical protein
MKAWLLSSKGHAAVSMALLLGSQFFPQYGAMIQALAGAFGYGAVVASDPLAPPAKK